MDMPTWTLEYPYKNPFQALTFQLPGIDDYERPESNNRPEKNTGTPSGIPRTDGYEWIRLETSLQWRFFCRSIQLLRERGNKVFVLVGPFNEHMLDGTSLEAYLKIKSEIELWLSANNINYYMPPALPAELYQDASHPISEGYALLAQQLYTNEAFKSFCLIGRYAKPPEGSLNSSQD